MKEKINFFIVICFLNKIFNETKIAISFGKDTNYLFNELNLCYYFIKSFR